MSETLETLLGAPVAVEELKRKPGRRLTLRASGSRRTAVVKLYRSDRAPVVASRIAALAAGPPEPAVPHVLHLDPERRMLVLSHLDGVPLRELLLAGDAYGCARVGEALGSWHAHWRGAQRDALAPHAFEDEERILLARAAAAPPEITAGVRAALPGLRGGWECTTVVHRDLYEEQVLVGERVGLIDLDDAALGPPELDVGNLLGHVELLALRAGGDLTREIGALLDGYGRDALDDGLLDRCRRLTLLRLSCIHGVAELAGRARTREVVGA